MKKLISGHGAYTFDASAQTITFASPMNLDGFLLITNVTYNVIIYNFADATKGGSVFSTVLTLMYDTSLMADSDHLQIFYDDATHPLTDTELRVADVKVTLDGESVSISSIPAVTGTVTANISGSVANTAFGVNNAGGGSAVNIQDGGNSITVDGSVNVGTVTTLPAITGSVSVSSGNITETNSGSVKTAVESINTKLVSGTDIGDVTINNASGAYAVNIQDGGNTITVDGSVSVSSIPHDTLTSSDVVTVTGGTGQVADVKVTLDSESVSVSNMIAAVETGLAKDSSLGTGGTLHSDITTTQPRKLQDGSGNAITSTGSALDVNVKSSDKASENNLALHIYFSGDDIFVCKASPGAALSASVWQVKKLNTASDISGVWANSAATFINPATNLATVQGLTYG